MKGKIFLNVLKGNKFMMKNMNIDDNHDGEYEACERN